MLNYDIRQDSLIDDERLFNKILGVKFLASGKLKGKPRSSILNMSLGNIPIQSLGMCIEHAKQHIYTRYGVFGFKIWLNRGYKK